jgi:hypothetical protein
LKYASRIGQAEAEGEYCNSVEGESMMSSGNYTEIMSLNFSIAEPISKESWHKLQALQRDLHHGIYQVINFFNRCKYFYMFIF